MFTTGFPSLARVTLYLTDTSDSVPHRQERSLGSFLGAAWLTIPSRVLIARLKQTRRPSYGRNGTGESFGTSDP